MLIVGVLLVQPGALADEPVRPVDDRRADQIAGFVQGLGTGLLFAPLNTLAYATLAPIHRTEGTIVATMARSLGSSVGISMLQAC